MFRSRSSLSAISLSLSLAILIGPAFTGRTLAQPAKLKWTDNTEKTTIEAEYVRMAEGAVVLKRDGKEITVPLAKLSMASHLQALKLAKPDAFSKAPPKAVVGIEQTAESTKLLNETPFAENQTVEQFLDTIATELQNGNGTVLWHALTPEMQADVEDLIVSAVDAGGKGMMVQVRSLMKNVGTLVHDKKAFILANPLIAQNQQAVKDLDRAWPKIDAAVTAFTDKTNWDSANFKAGNVGPWIAGFSAKLGKPMYDVVELVWQSTLPGAPIDKRVSYKILSKSDTAATLQLINSPGKDPRTGKEIAPIPSPKIELVNVSGKWLPKELVTDWKSNVAEMKSQLESEMPKMSAGLGLAIPVVSSLANAKTQVEFNTALQQIMAPILGAMGGPNGMAGMQGGNFGGAQPGGAPSGAPGGRPGRPSLNSQ